MMPWLRRGVFYVLLFIIWEALARSGIWPPWLFPGPTQVFAAFMSMATKGLLLQASLISIQRIALGYGLSLIIGIPLGLLIGRVRLLGETVGSLVIGLQALPSICWLPLAILWMGLSEQAIIFVVILGALFSITLGVENGVKNTPPLYLKAARTLGARGLAMYIEVILPAALPAVLSGLKQGWAFAWRSLMAGELLFYTLSIGNLLQTGRDLNDVAQVMAVMFVIILIGVTIDQALFSPIERHVRARWGLTSQEDR
jgi:NitT/TauT family transport system permease protein